MNGNIARNGQSASGLFSASEAQASSQDKPFADAATPAIRAQPFQ